MSEAVHNNAKSLIGDDMDQGQGSSNQAARNMPTNPSIGSQVTPMMPENSDNTNYWQTLVSELMN